MISLVLPVHRQADHIGAIVAEYVTALARVPAVCELLLVANGRDDGSRAECRSAAERFPQVRALVREEGGWGGAVIHGLAEARGELLGYTNSARTSPDDLVLFLLYALAYPGIVIKANRKIRESATRRAGSLLYNLQCRSLFDLPTWDVNGTPKLFPRSFTALLSLSEPGDLIDAEFAAICRREGYPMLEVPLISTRRHGGRSTTSFRSALRLYWGAIRLKRRRA